MPQISQLAETFASQIFWLLVTFGFVFIIFVTLLELLVCAIQAYVFALLTTLYLNDAINLH